MKSKTQSIWSDAERRAWDVSRYATISAWAMDTIVLPPTTPEPGPLDLGRTPYLIPILDAIGAPWVRKITFIAGSQIGKTTVEIILAGWAMAEHPTEMLFLMGRAEDAETLAVNRVKPIIECSPRLIELVTSVSRQLKRDRIEVNGAAIYFDTATSKAAVSSKPIEILLCDEMHLHPVSLGGEGSPYHLGEMRVSNYPSGKIIDTSTPTDAEMLGWVHFEQGTQHVWHIRCPHCGGLQIYKLASIKIPDGERNPQRMRALKLAWYECEKCGVRITELEKDKALRGGQFIANNQDVEHPTHMSFYVSGVASPWRSYSDIIAQFFESKDNPEKLQAFYNTVLGENWQDRIATVDISDIEKRAAVGAIERGLLPNETQMLTAGVDWHGERKGFYFSVWAWGYGNRGWLVDYGNVFSTVDLIAAIDGQDWHTVDGVVLRPFVGVDSGWQAAEVYEFTRALYPRWRPTKGEDEIIGATVKDSKVEFRDKKRGALLHNFSLLRINTNYYKDLLATEIKSGDDDQHLYFPLGNNDDFFRHLSAETKVRQKNGKYSWVRKFQGIDNHYLDAAIIARAVAERWGLHRMQPMERVSSVRQSISGSYAAVGQASGNKTFWKIGR